MSTLPLALRLGLGAACAAALCVGPAAAQQSVALQPKALRDAELLLPAPAVREVAGGFLAAPGGAPRFAAASEGDLLRADLDADGVMEAIVEGESGFLTLHAARNGGGEFRYSVRLEHRPFQPWTWTVGGGMAGEIAGTPVLLLDQNLDGDFDDFGADAIVVGRDHAASFLSKVVSIGGALYALEVAPDASSMRYAPWSGPTGTLDLLDSFHGKAKLDAAVVVNADASLSFSLARASGGLLVPAGEYRLHSGRLVLGEASAAISAGSSRPILVAAGARAAPAWGGPVRAEFALQRGHGEISLAPWDIWFYGSLGEEYANFLPLGESPLFTVKDRVTGEPLVYARFPGNC